MDAKSVARSEDAPPPGCTGRSSAWFLPPPGGQVRQVGRLRRRRRLPSCPGVAALCDPTGLGDGATAAAGSPAGSTMADAYHWEARRRQMQLERRCREMMMMQARGPYGGQQHDYVLRDIQAKCSIPPPSSTVSQHPVSQGVGADCCQCRTYHVPNHSGKLLKRYSTTEYTQQW